MWPTTGRPTRRRAATTATATEMWPTDGDPAAADVDSEPADGDAAAGRGEDDSTQSIAVVSMPRASDPSTAAITVINAKPV